MTEYMDKTRIQALELMLTAECDDVSYCAEGSDDTLVQALTAAECRDRSQAWQLMTETDENWARATAWRIESYYRSE